MDSGKDTRGEGLLLQHPDQSDAMDEASGVNDSCGGEIAEWLLEKITDQSQRALVNQPWKEYTAEGGRKYWYNTETKQSSWEMPEVYKKALAQAPPSLPTPP